MPNPEQLSAFVSWYRKQITGDEKGQAQIFLDRLFQDFGLGGSLDIGGTAEFRIRKSNEDGGRTSFADYVWKPVVLIKMKRAQESPETLSPGVRLLDALRSEPPDQSATFVNDFVLLRKLHCLISGINPQSMLKPTHK